MATRTGTRRAAPSARPKRRTGASSSEPAFGKKLGSLKAAKAAVKKGSGGGSSWIRYVPADESMTLRFLQEPDEFIEYQECWDEANRRSFPYAEGLVEGEDYTRKSTAYLACAFDVDSGRVIAFQVKVSVLTTLVNRYEKYGTIMDRDYEISRYGKGKNGTKYEVTPESPSKFNADKHDLLDLHAVLKAAYDEAMGDTDDDDGETVQPTRRGKAQARPKRGRAADDDDDDDDDDEDEDEDDESEDDEDDTDEEDSDWWDEVTMMDRVAMPLSQLKEYAKDDVGLTGAILKSKNRREIVSAIMAETGQDE